MTHGGSPPVDEAVRVLRAGGLVAFPTETVYGLGADVRNGAAIDRVFAVKGRPRHHPLIVHLGGAHRLDAWTSAVPASARRLAEAFWPGPLTMILGRGARVPHAVTGGQETVGIRVPAHPVAQALLAAFGSGIAAPSANRFGRVSPTRADHVRADLGGDVDLVLDGGPSDVGIESTIVDLTSGTPRVLRPGHITNDHLAAVLGEPVATVAGPSSPRAPGTLEAHYSPHLPLELLERDEIEERLAREANELAVLAFDEALVAPARAGMQASPDPVVYARRLYATLRELDASGAARIIVETPPPDDARWAGVLDRLQRASRRPR